MKTITMQLEEYEDDVNRARNEGHLNRHQSFIDALENEATGIQQRWSYPEGVMGERMATIINVLRKGCYVKDSES